MFVFAPIFLIICFGGLAFDEKASVFLK